MYKFNGFTEKANKAINLAIDSAQRMGHTYVGSEHILLGLLLSGEGAAFTILDKCGASADELARLIEENQGSGAKQASMVIYCEAERSRDDFGGLKTTVTEGLVKVLGEKYGEKNVAVT